MCAHTCDVYAHGCVHVVCARVSCACMCAHGCVCVCSCVVCMCVVCAHVCSCELCARVRVDMSCVPAPEQEPSALPKGKWRRELSLSPRCTSAIRPPSAWGGPEARGGSRPSGPWSGWSPPPASRLRLLAPHSALPPSSSPRPGKPTAIQACCSLQPCSCLPARPSSTLLSGLEPGAGPRWTVCGGRWAEAKARPGRWAPSPWVLGPGSRASGRVSPRPVPRSRLWSRLLT